MPTANKSFRLTPDTARDIATFADYEGCSQNQWVSAALDKAVAERRADRVYMLRLAGYLSRRLESIEGVAGKLEQLVP